MSRLQLLDAAEEVFGRRGYKEATLRQIAEQAEYSVGSVYSFFESKEDLLTQIFARRGAELLPQIRDACAGPGTALELLEHVGDVVIDYYRAHPSFGLLTLRFMSFDAEVAGDRQADAAIRANYAEVVALLSRLVGAGQAEGEIEGGDPESFGRMWLSMIHAYHSMDPWLGASPPAAVDEERFSRADFHALVRRAFGAART